MATRPIPRFRKGWYWGIAFAIGALVSPSTEAQPKAKTKAVKPRPPTALENDPLTEWELVNGAAIELREKLARRPPDREALRRKLADLALRSAIGAERALAIGNARLFDSYLRQFREQFQDIHWRVGLRAARGVAAAKYAAGVLALHGILEPVSVETACRHFAEALDNGYGGAKFRASQCLEETDPARAAELLRGAAANGHPAAAELVGRSCLARKPPDTPCAWDLMTVAAVAGRPSAQSLLGWMYVQGSGGRPADPDRAARLYLQAARAGDAAAQNNIGELYETGRGVPTDLAQALLWYRNAAEAGFPPAQFNLGRLHAAGSGTARDFTEARRWLEQAERGGIAQAGVLLTWMEKESSAK